MRVHKRPLAGGMPFWAVGSIGLMVAGATLVGVLHSGWPFGLVLFLFGLWLGLHRFERWQCRRCRTMYREVVGDKASLHDHKTLRAGS